MLNLMYITNNPEVAKIAEESGVNWIFVDMEFIGKGARQGGLDTVQNHHTIEDIASIKSSLNKAKVLVRINPIHQNVEGYFDSKEEIDAAINAGADILMLPYFRTVKEVEEFIAHVGGRVQTCLLLETPEAAILIDEILTVPGIDMIHIGLNDMHLAMGMKFMFQLLTNGTVDSLASKIKARGIPFGFGGVANLHGGVLPGSYVLKEHYRLGSSMVILSRSFCNTNVIVDKEEIRKTFHAGMTEMRELETEIQKLVDCNAIDYFDANHQCVVEAVRRIVQEKNKLS